jgi:hypothetical protein
MTNSSIWCQRSNSQFEGSSSNQLSIYETTNLYSDILESITVTLKNPSIALGNNDFGGGLITYRNGKYEWIHQTC